MSSKPSKKQPADAGHPTGSQPSEVWTYFDRLMDGFDIVCKQKQCRKLIERKDSKHTDDMWKHLEQAHEDLYKETEHSQHSGKPGKPDLEKTPIVTRSSKAVPKKEALDDMQALVPVGESHVKDIDDATLKPEDSKVDSPRKTRKRATAAPESSEDEASKPAGPSKSALRTTAESSEPKKKHPKADDKSYESRLIAAVRRQPGLYDPKHNDYIPRQLNIALWTTVANEVGITTEQAHADWKALRDRFGRQLHRRKEEGKEVSWPHYDEMSFLSPFMQSKKKNGTTYKSAGAAETQTQDEDAEDEEEDDVKEKADDARTFEDLIVEQVQRFACLYDITHDDFNSRKKKKEVWGLVGKALKNSTRDVSNRWQMLRKNFWKMVKRADGDALKRLKEHKLAFLLPFMTHSAEGETAANDDGPVDLEDMPEVTVEIPKFEEHDQEHADEVDQEPIDSDDDSVDGGDEDDDDEEGDASEAAENNAPEDATNGAEVAVLKQGQQSRVCAAYLDAFSVRVRDKRRSERK